MFPRLRFALLKARNLFVSYRNTWDGRLFVFNEGGRWLTFSAWTGARQPGLRLWLGYPLWFNVDISFRWWRR